MTDTTDPQLIALTQELLDAIVAGDWATYQRMCDPTLTAFEPEARGHLVGGMEFHQFYFHLQRETTPAQTTMIAPHVRRLGVDVAVVSYVRLIQHLDASNAAQTACFEETRIWHRQDGAWRNVHFHRSTS
jgi:calcium/calmodulin-dependent protein kinase (CaM kinase) II